MPCPRRVLPRRLPGLLLPLSLLVAFSVAAAGTDEYRVGVNDLLSVSVFAGVGTEPINIEATVAGDGTIDIIHLGPFAVADKTTSEIRDGIRNALVQGGFYRSPQVAVNIAEYRSRGVNVTGLVNEAGRYFLEGPTRLVDILSKAKGVKEAEAAGEVHVIREGQAEPIRVKRSDLYASDPAVRERANILLRAGDTVHVPQLAQFCVLGPVMEPDCYDYNAAMTLDEAISKAGGLDTTKADRHAITIRRTSAGSLVEFSADLDDAGPSGARFQIEEGDQIVVSEAQLYVTVDGSVKEPGRKEWFPGMTITDAIAEAGGPQGDFWLGNLKKVVLRRGGEVHEINVKRIQQGKDPDRPVEAGDKIFVPARVLG